MPELVLAVLARPEPAERNHDDAEPERTATPGLESHFLILLNVKVTIFHYLQGLF